MQRVGYFHCEECFEERLFVNWEPPYDPYACSCSTCGYQFGQGGYHVVERVVDLNDGRDGPPEHVLVAEPKPVLSVEVMRAGMLRLRREVARNIRESYGASSVFTRAQQRLDQGLAEEDPATRARLLNAPPIVPDRRKA